MGQSDGTVLGAFKLIDHGPAASCWNLIILAEGYKGPEMTKFENDAKLFVTALKATPPFDESWPVTNVYLLKVASSESGTDTGTTAVDTYFDAKLGGSAVERLLEVDEVLARNTALAYVPQSHAILVLVNTPEFGGSSGQVAVSSTTTTPVPFTEIALHELGHLAFDLADEYPSDVGCGEPGDTNTVFPAYLFTNDTDEPNITLYPNADKWGDLILPWTPLPTMKNPNPDECDARPNQAPDGTVGAYDGAVYYHSGVFRPEYSCKMRGDWGKPFCAVCRRRIRETLSVFLEPAASDLEAQFSEHHRRLCHLLRCLTSERVVNPHLIRVLEDAGVNWRDLQHCIRRFCSGS